MIELESYKNYFKSLIDAMQESGTLANDITFGFHTEFFYDYKNKVEITISALPAQIIKGIVQCPYQIKIDVDQDIMHEVKNILDDLFINLNETIITLDLEKYKQFYTTSAMTNGMIPSGITKYNTLIVNATLIDSTNILNFQTLTIGSSNNDGVSVIGPLVSYAITYEAETTSSGAIGTPETKSDTKTFVRNYSFVFVCDTSNTGVLNLIKQVTKDSTASKFVLTTKWQWEDANTAATQADYIVKTGSIDHDLTNGMPLLRVILSRRL